MTNYISLETQEDIIKRQNFFYISALFWFVWIVFHFTVVFFFWIMLKSIALVWIFLWIWTFVALLLDIPIWVLQKYFKPKTLLITWQILMLLVWIIFLKFIFFYTNTYSDPEASKKITSIIITFFDSWLNVALLLIASWLYWAAKELNDITWLSYLMNNSDPSEYAEIISKNGLFFWWWSFLW
jgi:hypothetical protein